MTTDRTRAAASASIDAGGATGSSDQERDDEGGAGYGRPPRGRPFRPGQSGNPRGRPSRKRKFAWKLASAFDKKIEARENGEVFSITKLEAAVVQLANRAAQGDQSALLFAFSVLSDEPDLPPAPEPERLGEDDSLVVAELMRRFRRRSPPDASSCAAPGSG